MFTGFSDTQTPFLFQAAPSSTWRTFSCLTCYLRRDWKVVKISCGKCSLVPADSSRWATGRNKNVSVNVSTSLWLVAQQVEG